MFTLPQLLEEDLRVLDGTLRELLAKSEAAAALLIDKGGFLITEQGETGSFDGTTVAALSAGAFCANKEIASLLGEAGFSSVYQQGDRLNVLVHNVDEHCLLVVLFGPKTGVGAVKYFATEAVKRVADQLQRAAERNPDTGLDLSVLNVADTTAVFQRRAV
jgi:predicted regulator of Ras-like GTPase activity (Roadblock/LC7/MglB family)